jgi:hypothetical protein
MNEHVRNWLLPQRSMRHELVEETLDVPPHGQFLLLRRPSGTAALTRDAIANRLGRYTDGSMPFVGLVVDLSGSEYQFSSADLGAVVASTAAWTRGWVAPCAIVLTGKPASQLQVLLNITKLSTLPHLRVVSSLDEARTHVVNYLDRRDAG